MLYKILYNINQIKVKVYILSISISHPTWSRGVIADCPNRHPSKPLKWCKDGGKLFLRLSVICEDQVKVFKAAEINQMLEAFWSWVIHLDGQASQVRERVHQKPQLVGGWEIESSQVRQRDVDEGWARRSQKGEQLLQVLQHSSLLGVLHLDCPHTAAMPPEHVDEGLGGGGEDQHGRQKSESPPEVGGVVDCGMQKLARGCEG